MSGQPERIIDPTSGAEASVAPVALATRLTSLEGLTLGLLNNQKPNAELLLTELGGRLKASYGVRDFVLYTKRSFSQPAELSQIQHIVENCDVALVASGD